MILIFGLCIYCNPKWISHIPCTIILALVSVRVVHCRQSHARLPELHVEMIESRTKKTFNNNKSLPFIFHPTVSVPPLAAARAGGQESRSLSRARRFTCSVPATPRKRQPCRVASASRLPPIGGGGGTPVGVRAAQRQRPLWKLRRGDVAGRRTAPPHHYLLLLLLPKSHQLLLLSPTIALSLYKSHPAWPFRPRRLHQIQARFSRAAARRLGSYISPAPLPAPGFHRSALLYCPVIPWQREPPPSCLHSSCHAWPIYSLRSGLPQTCRCFPVGFSLVISPRFVLRGFGVWHRLSIQFYNF